MPRARKRCGQCDQPMPCPIHTRAPWANSNRRAHLPSNWASLSKRILKRDPTCRLGYDGCTHVSTEVDHAGHKDDHRPHMLRGVCHPCHVKRTAQQSAQAQRDRAQLLHIAPEMHPGLTGGGEPSPRRF